MGFQCGAAGTDRNTVLDWYRNFRRDSEERRVAATSARSVVVDDGCDGDTLSNSRADYFILMLEQIGARV